MSENRIIGEDGRFPIWPEHINTDEHFFNAFDHTETEISARWIVRFIQNRREGWRPFTKAELQAFYAKNYSHNFCFIRLINPQMVPPSLARAFAGHWDPPVPRGGGWIIEGGDGKLYLTADFITNCFKSSPAKNKQPAAT